MNYEQCLSYLEKIQNLGIRFGLDNVRTILSYLDDPHQKYPSILVAGTNGKGSVCAMLTRILSLHGHRTGLFTSPHLIRVEERIRIGSDLISKQSFSRLLTFLKEKIEHLIASKKLLSPPTYFEMMSCLAFLYFKEQKVDIAVLEVGMGGRFDATNVVKPLVSVITTISYEHQTSLGDTLGQIAFEKAGIIRSGVPVVCGVETAEAYETVKKKAAELDAPFIGVFDKKGCFKEQKTGANYIFKYIYGGSEYAYSPSLYGEHQGKNAAVAIAASEQISKNWKKLHKTKIIEGLQTVKWAGRLEIISRQPLILLDGAHNEEGAIALRRYVQDFVGFPRILIFAVMRDKKIENLAKILFPLVNKIILTCFPYYRAASPEEIKDRASEYHDQIFLEPDLKNAVQVAVRNAETNGAVLIAGSLFLVGEIKKIFETNQADVLIF